MITDAFKALLAAEFEVTDIVEDGGALVETALRTKPDLALIDVSLPVLNGIEAARRILAGSPDTKIVFLTMNQDPSLAAAAYRLGASGFLLKNSAVSELTDCLHAVLAGDLYLTRLLADGNVADLLREAGEVDDSHALSDRERGVVRWLAEGKAMKEVAFLLGISPRTVQFHKYRVMARYQIKSNAELVRFAMKNNLL
jgi:DNA-binding NarL/FixJ family response regulator